MKQDSPAEEENLKRKLTSELSETFSSIAIQESFEVNFEHDGKKIFWVMMLMMVVFHLFVGLCLIPGSPKAPGQKGSNAFVRSWSNWIGVWPLAVEGMGQVLQADRAGIGGGTRSFLS